MFHDSNGKSCLLSHVRFWIATDGFRMILSRSHFVTMGARQRRIRINRFVYRMLAIHREHQDLHIWILVWFFFWALESHAAWKFIWWSIYCNLKRLLTICQRNKNSKSHADTYQNLSLSHFNGNSNEYVCGIFSSSVNHWLWFDSVENIYNYIIQIELTCVHFTFSTIRSRNRSI